MPDRHQLRQARIALNLTLSELATAISASRSAVSKIETGWTGSDSDLANKLTSFFECSGVQFGTEGQVRLDPRLQLVAGRRVN